jgi:hypothetical protein
MSEVTDERLAEFIDTLRNGWERDGDTEDEMAAAIEAFQSLRRKLREAKEALDSGADLLANEAAAERANSGRYPVETSYFRKYDLRARTAARESDQLRALKELVK